MVSLADFALGLLAGVLLMLGAHLYLDAQQTKARKAEAARAGVADRARAAAAARKAKEEEEAKTATDDIKEKKKEEEKKEKKEDVVVVEKKKEKEEEKEEEANKEEAKTTVSSPSRFAPVLADAFEMLATFLRLTESFETITETKGVKVQRLDSNKAKPGLLPSADVQLLRGEGIIQCDPWVVFHVTQDIERKTEYDPMLEKAAVVEELGGNARVIHQQFKSPAPFVSGRDFVTVSGHRVEESSGRILTVTSSVVHEDVPEDAKKYVRGTIVVGSLVFEPVIDAHTGKRNTIVTYLAMVNPKGSLPKAVVKTASTKQPLCIAGIRDVIDKIPEDEREAIKARYMPTEVEEELVPVETPEEEKEEEEEKTTEEEKAAEEEKAEEEEKAAPAVPSETVVVSPARTKGAPPPSAAQEALVRRGEENVSLLLEENARAGHALELSSMRDGATPARAGGAARDGENQWAVQGIEKDVVLLRKVVPGQRIHSFMGRGYLPASAETVFKILADPVQRKHYDPLLKRITVLDAIDDGKGGCEVTHMEFEAKRCMMTHSRDFCVLVCQRPDLQGRYVVAGTSIDAAACPAPRSGVLRAEIISSGWILEDVTHNGSRKCLAVYISQVDLKGAPPAIVNVVSTKQPLCIAYLRKYLATLSLEPDTQYN